jgi:hypothetical protein
MAQQLAMGVGVAGALVDVSADAKLDANIQYSWGRRSEFDEADAGRFSFTLDNRTGRYTPGNPLSTLATKLTEGMAVSWSCGGRLRAGTILSMSPTFPKGEAAFAEVLVTCDDMLGSAGRRRLVSPFTAAMVLGASPYLYYRFDDPAGAVVAAETSGRNQPPFGRFRTNDVFGNDGFRAIGSDTQLLAALTVGQTLPTAPAFLSGVPVAQNTYTTIDYAAGSMGVWGVWMTPTSAASDCLITVSVNGLLTPPLTFGLKQNFGPKFFITNGAAGDFLSAVPATIGVARYLQIVVTYTGSTSITYAFFVDGVFQVSRNFLNFGAAPNGLSTNFARTPNRIDILNNSGSALISHLSHTPAPVNEWAFNNANAAGVFALVDGTVSDVTLAALPSALAPARIEPPNAGSALDALNQIVTTEQGEIYSEVTGTFLAPVERLRVRERTRPAAVMSSWSASGEIEGAPDFVRDITNMAAAVTASGPFDDVLFFDPTLTSRLGSANVSESVLNVDNSDLLLFAQDRLQRGANVQLRIASLTIDAMTTPTNRNAELLALIPGDRHRVINLPQAQLGFASWDGWLLGATETHNEREHKFTLYFKPVVPIGVYGFTPYMADGALSLSAGVTASATSMSVATSTPLARLETAEFPYNLIVGAEQVTVTACTTASPQVMTVVRGVNGTSAAAHSGGALLEVAVPSLYNF